MIEVMLPQGYPAYIFEKEDYLSYDGVELCSDKYNCIKTGAATVLTNYRGKLEVVKNHNDINDLSDKELLAFCDRSINKVWNDNIEQRFELMEI